MTMTTVKKKRRSIKRRCGKRSRESSILSVITSGHSATHLSTRGNLKPRRKTQRRGLHRHGNATNGVNNNAVV